MSAGKVQHWKHGWIPVSAEARAFVQGRGPRPQGKDNLRLMSGSNNRAPNERQGIPQIGGGKFKDDRTGSDARARDIQELVPAIGPVAPHYQEASQSLRARYTGGVVLRPNQVDTLVRQLSDSQEGTISDAAANRAAGITPSRPEGGTPRDLAERRATALRDALGMQSTPLPEYLPGARQGDDRAAVDRAYTGGLVLLPTVADDLIDKLRRNHTGTITDAELRRFGG